MELLRRSLLLGSLLPGLWLLQLTFLDPVVTISPATTSAGQLIQRGSGPGWETLLADLDGISSGRVSPRISGRLTRSGSDQGSFNLFVPANDAVVGQTLWNLVAPHRTAYIQASRSGGGPLYRLELHAWSGSDFRPGAGFTGQPRPPDSLLYPLRLLGIALMLVGALLFVVLPNPVRSTRPLAPLEVAYLAGVVVAFAAPLVVVGGSVQALTEAPWLTIPCWILAAGSMHLFARPLGHLRLNLGDSGDASAVRSDAQQHPAFVRVGAAFLAVAVGPAAAVVMASMALWSR